MQQPIRNKPGYPLLAKFGHSNDEYFFPIRRNFLTLRHNFPISTGNNAQLMETTDVLISRGKQLALSLAEILAKLKAHDESAMYPITAILNPFFEVTELDLHILPIPVVSGATQPEVNDVREESFFRFLDELESGAYSEDDTITEE